MPRPLSTTATTGVAWPWHLPPAALAIGLRCFHLRSQILGGDELNGVQRALELTVGQALTTYHLADNCLPLTALYRVLLNLGCAPTELLFRAPSLAAGIALALFAPWAIARRVSPAAGVCAAWLLALSPILVLYSRVARPYEALALVAFAALLAFDAWWRHGGRAAATAFALLGALAVYLHLGAAPFIAAPFCFALWQRLRRRPGGRSLAASCALGAATAVCCLAFLVPAWGSLRELVAAKQDPLAVTWSTAGAVLTLEAGSGTRALVVVFWSLVAMGFVRLVRSERSFAELTTACVALQLGGLLALHPEMLEHPLVFDRYLIPILPVLIVWAACAPAALPRGATRTAVAAAMVVMLAAGSPFGRAIYRYTSFSASNDFIDFFAPPAAPGPAGVPGIYSHLRGGPVLEAPWNGFWSYGAAYYVYQERHRQDVLLCLTGREPPADRLRFRNATAASPEAVLGSRARYLVVHEDLPAETAALAAHSWPFLRDFERAHADQARAQARHLLRDLRATWGEPDFTGPGVAAWDLARIRAGHPRADAVAGSPMLP